MGGDIHLGLDALLNVIYIIKIFMENHIASKTNLAKIEMLSGFIPISTKKASSYHVKNLYGNPKDKRAIHENALLEHLFLDPQKPNLI